MPKVAKCEQCGANVEPKAMERHLQRHEKDKALPKLIVTCVCCGETRETEHGSKRFCSRKCGRAFSTKEKRKEINERLKTSLLKVRICVTCLLPYTKPPKTKKRDECPECWQRGAIRRKQKASEILALKMRSVAMLRIDRGERWFGTQTSYKFRGTDISCDSLLEQACLMMIDSEWADVLSIKRCDFWIPYGMPGEKSDARRYNPDFIAEFADRCVIVEVKSERMCKSDTWEDYREKSLVKQRVLEEYARINGYEVFWCTQRTCKKYYSKVLMSVDRPVKRRKTE